MKRMKRIYAVNDDSKNTKTVVFEEYSIREIIVELKRFYAITGVTNCEVVKVTYDITEE